MDKRTAYRLGQRDYHKGLAPNAQRVPSDVASNYETGYQDAQMEGH